MIHLIDNWRAWPRMLSQQLVMIDAAVLAAWLACPPESKELVHELLQSHPHWMPLLGLGWCGLKLFVRLIDQGITVATPPEKEPTP